MSRRVNTAARRIGQLEWVVVLLGVAPILIFDAWVPRWVVAGALAAIPLMWLIRWVGHGSPTRATPLDWPLLILLLMVLVGIWAAADVTRTLPEVYRIILGVAIYHALVNTLVEARHIQVASVLLVLATGGLVLATLLGTNWGADKLALPFVGSLTRRLPTLVSPFWKPGGLNPAPVGASLAMLVPIAIAFLLGARKWTIRILAAGAALAGSLVLLFSQSRSGLLGFALALLAMGVAYARRFLVVVVILVAFGLGAILVAGPFPTDRLLGAAGGGGALEGLEGRLEIWSRALYMIQDFPLTGVGLGMFDPVLDMLYPLFSHDPSTRVYHAHNIFLAQAVTVGLPGLVAIGSMLLLLLVMAFQCVRLSRSGPFRPLAIGLLGAVTGYLGHGVFDSTDSLIRVNTIVWMIFGLQTALWLHLNSELLPRAESEVRIGGAISEPDGSLDRSG